MEKIMGIGVSVTNGKTVTVQGDAIGATTTGGRVGRIGKVAGKSGSSRAVVTDGTGTVNVGGKKADVSEER
jgi:hypothetical protein